MKKKASPEALVNSILLKKLSREEKLQLFEQYKNLVYYVAHKFPYRNQTIFQEICCAGMLGLLHAIEHHDEKRKTTFPIYAYKWILQFMRRELRNLSPIKLPQILLHYYSDIRNIEKSFFYENKRFPRPYEIVDELVLKYPALKNNEREKKKLLNILQELQIELINLDEEKLSRFFERASLHDNYNIYYNLYKNYLEEVIRKGLELLDKRKAQIIKLHFGLENNMQWNLASIGRYLKISRERARQLLNSALKQLRSIVVKKNFEFQARSR